MTPVAWLASCGPRALSRAIGTGSPGLNQLGRWAGTNARGTTLEGLRRAAQRAGFDAVAGWTDYPTAQMLPTPFVAHFRSGHFVAVTRCCATHVELVGSRSSTMPRGVFEHDWSRAVLLLQPPFQKGSRT
jgi:ABC-type bacteriocin/lantibiotic exporter with double-glycine peptidase domain